MKNVLLPLMVLLLNIAQAQVINTIAGNGTKGYADGAALSAEMFYPTGVAVDAAGNVYIADMGNNLIRKLTVATGIVSTIAGNGIGGSSYGYIGTGTGAYTGDGYAAIGAGLSSPNGVAVDAGGNVYIADAANNAIRKINTAGIISTIAGNGTAGSFGNGVPATTALLDTPSGIATDNAGNIYIADLGNNMVRKINSSGIITTIAGNGSPLASGDGGPATAAGLGAFAVAVDAAGNVYIADSKNHAVRKVNTAGMISTLGGPPTVMFTIYPQGIAVDVAGNVFVADPEVNSIIKIDAADSAYTICGNGGRGYAGDGGPATAAEVWGAQGIAVDNSGNLYIADWGNYKIRKVHYPTAAIANVNAVATGIEMYPNPATADLYIAATEKIHAVAIYNPLGQVLFSGNYAAEKVNIDLSFLLDGVYYVKVNGCNAQKLIKQ